MELYDLAFRSYALHEMYQSVEGLSLGGDMVEFWQSTQKMRTDLVKTLDP